MTKIFATSVEGRLIKMKDLPDNKAFLKQEGLEDFKVQHLLQTHHDKQEVTLITCVSLYSSQRLIVRGVLQEITAYQAPENEDFKQAFG